jgi:ABC-type nitrate/sulfonate/bicarbonate transport system substrate-binding protein
VVTTVNVLASAISHMSLWYVWRDSGVAERHGLDLRVDVAGWDLDDRPVRTMADRAPALLEGDYQFVSGLHHEPYVYRARGDKRLTYVAQAQNNWDDRLVVAPEIEQASDLEGHTVLVTSSAPCVQGNLKNVLAKAGADPERIRFEAVAKPPDFHKRLREVADGEPMGAQVDIPFDLVAEEYGLRTLSLPQVPVVHNVTLCADASWLDDNRATASNFLRSMVDAIHFFKTRPDEVQRILAGTVCRLLGVQSDAQVTYLADAWAGLLSPKPYPHPLAVWNVYALDVAKTESLNHIDPLEPWDISLLREIDATGYIDDLYGYPVRNPAVAALI